MNNLDLGILIYNLGILIYNLGVPYHKIKGILIIYVISILVKYIIIKLDQSMHQIYKASSRNIDVTLEDYYIVTYRCS